VSSKRNSFRANFQPRLILVLLIASIFAIGIIQNRFYRSAQASTTAAFTPGNLVVYRVGDGSVALTAAAAPVFLDEYTPAGALVQTIPMPTAVSGANKRLTAAGNSTSEGFLTRSVDGNYLLVPGYDAAVATGAVAGTTSAATNRVIGRVDAAGNVDTTTALTDAISGGNPRGATSTNGTDLWISGTSAGGGIRYATFGATTSTALTTAVTNLRATNIFGGQLYVSSMSGTTRLVAVGTGTPTTSPQTLNALPGLDSTTLNGPYTFFFADLDGGVAGNDTVYVADDAGNQLKKFSLVGGTWVANGNLALAAARGMTASVSGTSVTLYTQNNGSTLSSVTDASGYNATITGTFTALATAASNTAFRGVALVPSSSAPSPTPTVTPALSINDVTQAETNAGTTTFTFTVSLNSPALAGGVTFDIATQDGTAQDGNPGSEDTDYVAKTELGRTITAGNTTASFTVTVNGDTTPESNETFFVNVTNVVGATVNDAQGLGTITNDDITATAIHTIQGNGSTSPLNGSLVSTTGVVTLLKSNGFFLQEPDATNDADPNTSEGIFVFTSSAPTVAVGDGVSVSGTVMEFGTTTLFGVTGTNTEIGNVTAVIVNSSGIPLPAFITLTAADLSPTALPSHPQFEKYEDMRVSAPLKTVAPNDSFFDVYTVLSSVARPFREVGMEISATIPSDPSSTANIPRWDENPERISVDTNGRAGSTGLALTSNVSLGTVTGPLDFAFGEYHLIPEVDPTPSANMSAVPLPTPLPTEFTVACFNIENFANGATQRQKAARAIRQIMRYPDIIGHEEIGSLAGLQALSNEISSQAIAAGEPDPLYAAFLQGTGAQNVGFLVKTTRVSVGSVTEEPAGTYLDPITNTQMLMHDRPPLVLRATVDPSGPNPIPVIIVVNHPRSFIDIADDPSPPGVGKRVRAKRKAQAESIAALLQNLQTNNPGNSIMTIGDFNAFQFNDGYTDPIATIKGTPTADDQLVVDASPDVVNPDFFNLSDLLAPTERYSFVFAGTPQVLDQIIVNRNALARFTRNFVAHFDADFPDTPASAFVNDASRPEGASDHDAPVAYFNLTLAPSAANGVISGRITDNNGSPVAGTVIQLSGSQSRKAITDAQGSYRFNEVETNGFYTVTPSRTNYTISPASKSFSLVGNRSDADFTAIGGADNANPLDVAEYFVRQQYIDVLGREPDQAGFNYWSDQINACGADGDCLNARRRDVAAAFFIEQEMQLTGSFVYDLYKGALGRRPLYNEYAADRAQVVGGSDLEARKQAFAESFVRRSEFGQRYDLDTGAESFVDAIVANLRDASGVDLSNLRGSLIDCYNAGSSQVNSRSLVVREIADNASFKQAEYNGAFVLTEYFAYLHRNPDPNGYSFWLNVLNTGDPGNYRGMVCGFINSAEYQRRFSSVVSRSDASCSR